MGGGMDRVRVGGEDDVPIHDVTDLGVVSAEERALLAEDVDLAPWEKRRILAFVRVIRRGDDRELLGVPSTATRREIKRAYYALSKEFHPDRYYGKHLGSFGPLLSLVFESTTTAVDRLACRTLGAADPRRRASDRYPYSVPVKVRAASWPRPENAVTQDVSEGGVFVLTGRPAAPGEVVALSLGTPDLPQVELRGRVVSCRGRENATRWSRYPGLGVHLSPLSDEERSRYALVLAAARRAVPVPKGAPGPATTAPVPGAVETSRPRRRLARGTGAMTSPVVGIDLGTTFTCVSAARGDEVTLVPFADGARALPSVVAFPSAGEVVVGERARERLARDPRHTVPGVKRLLGRTAGDRRVDAHLAQAAYLTSAGPGGHIVVDMRGESYAVPQLCAYLLREVKRAAETALGQSVGRAVLTVPVTFSAERVRLLRRAAALADLEPVAILDEPSAAALANRHHPTFGGVLGLFDFGGGTFDFSVVDATAGDLRVLATDGDGWLGGDDLDLALTRAVAERYARATGIDLHGRAAEWQRLLAACEQAKRRLSTADVARVVVPEVAHTPAGPRELRVRVNRHTAEALWTDLVDRAVATARRALSSTGLRPADLAAVYLSGGTSYVPAVRRAVARDLGVPPRVGVPPEFSACLGAGILGAEIARRMPPSLRAR